MTLSSSHTIITHGTKHISRHAYNDVAVAAPLVLHQGAPRILRGRGWGFAFDYLCPCNIKGLAQYLNSFSDSNPGQSLLPTRMKSIFLHQQWNVMMR